MNISRYLLIAEDCSTFSNKHKNMVKPAKFKRNSDRVSLLDVREVLLHWDVVDPGFELGVEELLPFIPYVENQGAAQEKMLEAEAGCHTSEVK